MTTETRFGHVLVSVRPDMHVASCGMHRGIPSPVLPKSKPETQLKLRNGSFYSGTVNMVLTYSFLQNMKIATLPQRH